MTKGPSRTGTFPTAANSCIYSTERLRGQARIVNDGYGLTRGAQTGGNDAVLDRRNKVMETSHG